VHFSCLAHTRSDKPFFFSRSRRCGCVCELLSIACARMPTTLAFFFPRNLVFFFFRFFFSLLCCCFSRFLSTATVFVNRFSPSFYTCFYRLFFPSLVSVWNEGSCRSTKHKQVTVTHPCVCQRAVSRWFPEVKDNGRKHVCTACRQSFMYVISSRRSALESELYFASAATHIRCGAGSSGVTNSESEQQLAPGSRTFSST